MSRLETAIDAICSARRYNEDLLGHIDSADWFRQPSEGVTHVAWQVGHLAVAEFGLALIRIRGERPDDEALISKGFRRQFGKGSIPAADPSSYPSVEELRSVLKRVHDRVIQELTPLAEELLDEPTTPAHTMFSSKLGALNWCAAHEFIHAGQIALLRRLFGSDPLR